MERQFFTPFFNPFFFRPRFFPFFFISPFHRPFFHHRDEDERDGNFIHHECEHGDTLESLAERYNVPQPMLTELNTHLQNPSFLNPGDTMYIPRLNRMHCQRMYMADESQSHMHPGQMLQQPYPGMQQPYPGMQYPSNPAGM